MTLIIDQSLVLEHQNFSAPGAAPLGSPLGVAFTGYFQSWDSTATADVNNARWQFTGVPAYAYQLLELSVEVAAFTTSTVAGSIQDAVEFAEELRGYYQQQPLLANVEDRTQTSEAYRERRWPLKFESAEYRGTDTTGTVQKQGDFKIGVIPVSQGSPSTRWTGISTQSVQATPRIWLSFPAITSALSGANTLTFALYASYLYYDVADALSAPFQYAAPVAPR